MDISQLYDIFRRSKGVATDSRAIKGGELFFALKGENFDGNLFAQKALEAGAVMAVVNMDSQAAQSSDERIIPVEDSLKCLKELAAWHRNHCLPDGEHLKVIGLTGTNGKTTTKNLIREVLSCEYEVTATRGNLNNDIGVPLSVLEITPDTNIAVIEMGASHLEDIAALTPVCQPDFGLITNVGTAHILGFGSFEGVKHAKGRLYDYIAEHGGEVFVNQDDATLCEMADERNLPVIPYGLKYSDAEILPVDKENPYLRVHLIPEDLTIETHLVGSYNAPNVLAALALGRYFGVPMMDAVAAIENYIPDNCRSQIAETERNILIEDAYNANPSSVAAALDSFGNIQAERKVVMLGDMRELGEVSLEEHLKVVTRLAASENLDIYLVGEEFGKALEAAAQDKTEVATALDSGKISHFMTSAALAEYISTKHEISNATILIKGSRSTAMEKVIKVL